MYTLHGDGTTTPPPHPTHLIFDDLFIYLQQLKGAYDVIYNKRTNLLNI